MLVLLAVLGLVSGLSAEYVNIAVNGSATASSVGFGGQATRAIDGNTDGIWRRGSCYHSSETDGSTLEIDLPDKDLGAEYPVNEVVIYNRRDCCSNRLTGIKVWAGDHLCGELNHVPKQWIYNVSCGDKVTDKVTLEHSSQYLTVCEVMIMVDASYRPNITSYVNIAPQGTATATSVGWGGVAGRVNDGDTNGWWKGGTCYHSASATSSKVTVSLPHSDFGIEYPVSKVKVYNRRDACCDQRINGAKVWAGDHMCGQIQFSEQKMYYMLDCGNVNATEVSVSLEGQHLQICELQILVEEELLPNTEDLPTYINVAGNGTARASTVSWGGSASRVNDGDTNGKWGGKSCYHSNGDAGPHKVGVELAGWEFGVQYPVYKVKVHNRVDSCCDQRIDGATVWVDEHQCGQIQYVEGQAAYLVDCGGQLGGSVFVRLSTGQSLQVCELEVLVDEDQLPEVPVYTNVAVGRPASQSSIGWGGGAARAVDGKTWNRWKGKSCTHTSQKSGNWWQVDLDMDQYVEKVVLTNRVDCCSTRIDGAQVWVGRGEEWEDCGQVEYQQGVDTIVLECNLWGDKVKITQDNDYLTLCEVQVMVPEEQPTEMMDEEI